MRNDNQMNKKLATFHLPKSWSMVTIDEITFIVTDGSHNPPPKLEKGIPMLSAKNIHDNLITFDDVRYISEESFLKENTRIEVQTGDVLLTIVATIGRCAMVHTNITRKFTLQRSVAILKPAINSKYLMYNCQSPNFQKLLIQNAKGTAQKGEYLKTLKTLVIPLAPIEEQNRIVAKIEELFSELDHAEKGLLKAQKQLKVYRQTLLKNAFQLKDNWITLKVKDIFELIDGDRGKNYPKQSDYLNDGYCLFLSTKNVRLNIFMFEENVFILSGVIIFPSAGSKGFPTRSNYLAL